MNFKIMTMNLILVLGGIVVTIGITQGFASSYKAVFDIDRKSMII